MRDAQTPAALGYAMPAEWAPHARCWMAWPCRAALWGERLGAARSAYAAVARAIARFEPVTMVARPDDAGVARGMLGEAVPVLALPLDDSWMRDIGPTFVRHPDRGLAGVAWRFNAWGGKYADYADDARLARRLLAHLELPRLDAPFVLEGGALHVDGEGSALVTEQCLLNPNRNPGLSRAEIEGRLRAWLGVKTVIWLGQGLVDDETDGHVDNLACFVRPGVVMALTEDDPVDANHAALADNLVRLRAATDARGRRLEVIPVHEPAAHVIDGRRLALSYVNFYRANGAVVAPRFGDPRDAAFEATLARALPGLAIATVPAADILFGGGGIHCITQQQPA
jgi:agmatine deiminase